MPEQQAVPVVAGVPRWRVPQRRSCGWRGLCQRAPLVCDATTSPPRCTARAEEGSNCSSAVPCGLGLDCVGGVCVAQFSRDEGEACGERTCMAPLVCGTTTHTCVRTFSPTTIRKRVCSADTDCPDDCSCECDWGSGTRRCTIAKAPTASALVLYNEFATRSSHCGCSHATTNTNKQDALVHQEQRLLA